MTYRERYSERRQYMLDKLGRRCAKCGATDRLEVDHINRKLKTLSFGTPLHYSLEVLNKELENARLLCKPCHVAKTATEWEHGTEGGYVHHACRCSECKAAYSVAKRRRYARRVGTAFGTQRTFDMAGSAP